jgi:hypothetical protein
LGATSTSSTNSSVAATNPQLNALFTSLFSGGLGSGASSTLQSIMSGQQLQSNTSQLYKTLSQASQPQFQQGQAQINEQMARAGLSNSSSLGGVQGGYTSQYLANLTNTATQMGLSETQMQGGVAGNLLSMLGTAGSQYYTNKSTTSTQMPWTQTFSTLMGGAMGAASIFGSGGALEGLNPFG